MKTQLEFNIPKNPSEKYIRILEILSRIPEDKLDRLVTLLSKLEFIENDNSIVFNEDTIFKFLGKIEMKSNEEFYITSNHTKINPETGKPYSIRFNDDESKTIGEE